MTSCFSPSCENDIIRRFLSPEGKLISANALFFGNLEQKFKQKIQEN